MNEQEFLKQYDQQHYPRPSLAVDMAVFSVIRQETGNYRKLPEQKLSVLLIERAEHPFQNQWALPGGFVLPNETVETAARRELEEETGIKETDLRQLHIFSEPERDPRGWIISSSFSILTSSILSTRNFSLINIASTFFTAVLYPDLMLLFLIVFFLITSTLFLADLIFGIQKHLLVI